MKTPTYKKASRMFRRRIKRSLLEKYGSAILANTWNGDLLVEPGDFHVGRKLLRDGEYNRSEIERLKEVVGLEAKNMVVVGTHIGSLLIPLASASKKIVGFEPDEKNFELLKSNIRLNGITNAEIFHSAVGEAEGSVKIKRNMINTGNTSITARVNLSTIGDRDIDKLVKLTTLDKEITKDKIDLIIIDVEGHEQHVINGARETLRRTQKLYIEFAPEQLIEHGTRPEDLLDNLSVIFPYVYSWDIILKSDQSKNGCEQVKKEMKQRSYLINLLFSKTPMPSVECIR